jgi:hypothetical protein
LLSRDFSDGLGYFGLTRETEAGLDFRFIHHRFGVGFAPGVAASASLGSCKDFQDFLDFGIGFDGKFLGGKGQANAEEQADASKHGKSNES